MGHIISFPGGAGQQAQGAPDRLPIHIEAMLLHLVRATACAMDRPRDAVYAELLARERIGDLGELQRRRLPGVVAYLHGIQKRQIRHQKK